MATAFTENTKNEQLANRTFSAVQYKLPCTRCGGLMVNDSYIDLLNNVGESKFSSKRCVQCGEVVDSVILLNRQLRKDPMTAQRPGKILSNNRVTKGHIEGAFNQSRVVLVFLNQRGVSHEKLQSASGRIGGGIGGRSHLRRNSGGYAEQR